MQYAKIRATETGFLPVPVDISGGVRVEIIRYIIRWRNMTQTDTRNCATAAIHHSSSRRILQFRGEANTLRKHTQMHVSPRLITYIDERRYIIVQH